MKQTTVPNQIALDYLSKHYSYDEETGQLIRAGKVQGHKHNQGYLRISFAMKKHKLAYSPLVHQVIWFLCKGYWSTMEIDHIDGQKQNNFISNLREATRKQNAANTRKPKPRPSKSPQSQYKGVSSSGRKANPWKADFGKKHLGHFSTEEAAALAYNKAALAANPEHALINQIK